MTSGAVSDYLHLLTVSRFLIGPCDTCETPTLLGDWLCQVCENVVKRLLGLEWDVSEEEVTS